jgi:SAM-dependent methyltransferase
MMEREHSRDDDKTGTLLRIITGDLAAGPCSIRRVLVVGCGDGQEASVLAQVLDCPVTAIDVEDTFRCADPRVQFRRMDGRAMEFEDCSFDLVYSFHALEHIPEPVRALKEIARVLADGGVYCIGTPNRSRLIGYIGSAGTSWRQKVQWNIIDWTARLFGRFRNDLGAHAGFTAGELLCHCSVIGAGHNISDRYYYGNYNAFAAVLDAIRFLHLQAIAWPSVYVWGYKSVSAERTGA